MQIQNENNENSGNELKTVADFVPTKSFVAADRKIMDAVKNDRMVAIIGSTGLGKSEIKNLLMGKLREKRHTVIDILPALIKGRELTGSIAKQMIRALTGEAPAQDVIARATQLKRILLSQSSRQKLVLCIDEAQDLHPATLYGLKKIHELGGTHGRQFLFSIVLFGKEELSDMIRPTELGLRFDTHHMEFLTIEEMKAFVSAAGLKLDKKATVRLLANTLATPAAMEKRIRNLKFFFEGKTSLSDTDMHTYFMRDLPKRFKASGLSYREAAALITQRTGIHCDPGHLHKAVSGKADTTEKAQNMLTGLEDMLNEQEEKAALVKSRKVQRQVQHA
jgi:ABC-type dipeptide/oligopeptide/nickel transport system ATPase component